MTTSRLFPSTSGPSSPVSYSGNIIVGVSFQVTTGGQFFTGYWKWVAPGGDTTARKFALWAVTGAGTGVLIPAATVTSGTLTAGQWNFVATSAPVPLAIGMSYMAATGWSASAGFEDSDTGGAGTGAGDSFGTGGHTSGITQGALHAFSGHLGSSPEPWGNQQGTFDTSGTDASVKMPATGSNDGNFWLDIEIDDSPVGYSGSRRLWPNSVVTNPATVPDLNVNYSVATEIHLAESCDLDKIWYYSPAGTTQLATHASVWQVTGPSTGTKVATLVSPSWSGAAGSGWVSCTFSGVTLPAGTYKVSVYNDNASPDGWSAKDASTNYWDTGVGAAGITSGPLTAPGLAAASTAYEFDGAGAANTPPFSTSGGATERGQCTFYQPTSPPGTDAYPYLYVDGLAQNYWVDAEVTPDTSVSGAAALGAAGSLSGSGGPAGAGTLAGAGQLAAPAVRLGGAAVLGGAGSLAGSASGGNAPSSLYLPQAAGHPGGQPVMVPVSASDLTLTGRGYGLLILNASGAAVTVTLPVSVTWDGLGVASRAVQVPPGWTVIPVPSQVYGPGPQPVRYSASASVTCALIRIG